MLTHRIPKADDEAYLILPLSAEERTKLRGLRRTTCGCAVLLKLPRTTSLIPGEVLSGENQCPKVLVEAAIEELILVRANSPLELLKAAYHLGNRHVDLELHIHQLFLLKDPVLEKMLLQRGLSVKTVKRHFYPEAGAYSITHHH